MFLSDFLEILESLAEEFNYNNRNEILSIF